MRKEYDFSKAVRLSEVLARRRRKRRQATQGATPAADDEPLSATLAREIRRRAADLDDPVRYLLASQVTPRFVLYYNVTDDAYVLNDPKGATLFKRRKAAHSVKRLLGGRIRVIQCITRKRNGQRIPVLPRLPCKATHAKQGKRAAQHAVAGDGPLRGPRLNGGR